jgi:hypothetical protein
MLLNLIRQHALADAEDGDFAAVAATLSARTLAVENTKSWTMSDLINLVGPESAALIGGTIQAAGASNPIFAGAWIALNVTGLQLHTDERQAMIDGLAAAGSWPAELTAAVKAAGVTYTSLAGRDVTAEECEAEWKKSQLHAIVDDRYQSYVEKHNSAKSGIEDSTLTTAEQVNAVLEGV